MIVANLTMIVANLSLARSINYDHKVSCKLKGTFTIVNCDPKFFYGTSHWIIFKTIIMISFIAGNLTEKDL